MLADGRVAYAPDRLEVDREFVQLAREGRSPERRFRFAAPCVRGACAQWTGARCGVIDRVLEELPVAESAFLAELPRCSIRPQCRWFGQRGAAACGACPLIVTDLREQTEPENATAAGA